MIEYIGIGNSRAGRRTGGTGCNFNHGQNHVQQPKPRPAYPFEVVPYHLLVGLEKRGRVYIWEEKAGVGEILLDEAECL